MKFLHTADLHIGRTLGEISLLEDQRKILDDIAETAIQNSVEAVLIAGDVYQKSAPQAEAMELFDSFISKLSEAVTSVFVISGNHDSLKRISYFSKLIQKSGIYVARGFTGKLQTTEITDEHGPLYIHMLPYIRPIHVKLIYPEENIISYTDAIKTVIKHSEVDFSKRNILMAHQFITGGEAAGSEEKTVGTLDNVDSSAFEGFDYVALGHLHRAQKIGSERISYAGSPLKYSVSEADDLKSVILGEINEKGSLSLKKQPLRQPHELRRIEGAISEIYNERESSDYVWITVTDENVPPDTARMMKAVYPNMLRFSVSNSKTKLDLDVKGADEPEKLDPKQLFVSFYADQNNSALPGNAQIELFQKLFYSEADK